MIGLQNCKDEIDEKFDSVLKKGRKKTYCMRFFFVGHMSSESIQFGYD